MGTTPSPTHFRRAARRTDRPTLERQLLLHLTVAPQRVFEVSPECLTGLAREFVERLEVGPTLAREVGVACLIANTMSRESAADSKVVRLAAELEDVSIEELRTLPPFHVIVSELGQNSLEFPTKDAAMEIRPAWRRHLDRMRQGSR